MYDVLFSLNESFSTFGSYIHSVQIHLSVCLGTVNVFVCFLFGLYGAWIACAYGAKLEGRPCRAGRLL